MQDGRTRMRDAETGDGDGGRIKGMTERQVKRLERLQWLRSESESMIGR